MAIPEVAVFSSENGGYPKGWFHWKSQSKVDDEGYPGYPYDLGNPQMWKSMNINCVPNDLQIIDVAAPCRMFREVTQKNLPKRPLGHATKQALIFWSQVVVFCSSCKPCAKGQKYMLWHRGTEWNAHFRSFLGEISPIVGDSGPSRGCQAQERFWTSPASEKELVFKLESPKTSCFTVIFTITWWPQLGSYRVTPPFSDTTYIASQVMLFYQGISHPIPMVCHYIILYPHHIP